MNKKDPALWTALRLHRILSQVHRNAQVEPMSLLRLLLQEQKAVERGYRMFQLAQSRGWQHAAGILSQRLHSDIALVHDASRATRPPRIAAIPTVPDILGEITMLQDEFEEVEMLPKDGRVDVTTDEITLNDVRLGPFCIQLHLDRLTRKRDVSAFAIVAEEPNPAGSNRSYTHPHVSDKSLCPGEAAAPISNALAEGRIGDAFQIVNRVLHTYNPSSAYVSLDEWDGRECKDCGRTSSRDGLYFCKHCDQDFCDNCMRTCVACEEPVCLGCSTRNDDGDRLCPDCKELADQQSEEAEDDEEEATTVSGDGEADTENPTEEQPQPLTETTDEQSHSPDSPDPRRAELPGGTADAQDPGNATHVPTPHPQAA